MICSTRMQGELVRTGCGNPEEHFDVIVVGAGTAGAIAGIAAAEQGASVLVLEKGTYCGGIGTGGLVIRYYYGFSDGRYTEVDRRVKAREDGSGYLAGDGCVNAELKKIELEQTLRNVGAVLRYESAVTGVLMSAPDTVSGIRWQNASGEHLASAGCVIDATGDGQILFYAGAEFQFGRSSDGLAQPYTLNYSRIIGNQPAMNWGDSGNVNQNDPEELSAEILKSTASFLRNPFRGEDKMNFFSDLFCVREGRLAAGEETLTLADVLSGKIVSEPVAWELSNWDTHSMDLGLESDLAYQWGIAAMQWGTLMRIPVPRGALIPKNMHGLLCAGRMLAVDHDLAQAVRMKGCMQRIGEAAGVLAALAVGSALDVREVPYRLLAEKLNLPLRDAGVEPVLLEDSAAVSEALRSPMPGWGIWSAFRCGMTEELHPLLKEPATEIPAAIALALSGDRTALDPLRRIVAERLDTVPETLRNEPHRQEYCAIGVWLLGWLDDTYSLRRIADFFQERRNFTASLNAMNALLRIGERHAELRERIGEILLDGLSAPLPELPVPCFCSPQTLDGLNRLRILAAGRLNRWGIPHSFEELLKQASLGIVERNVCERSQS